MEGAEVAAEDAAPAAATSSSRRHTSAGAPAASGRSLPSKLRRGGGVSASASNAVAARGMPSTSSCAQPPQPSQPPPSQRAHERTATPSSGEGLDSVVVDDRFPGAMMYLTPETSSSPAQSTSQRSGQQQRARVWPSFHAKVLMARNHDGSLRQLALGDRFWALGPDDRLTLGMVVSRRGKSSVKLRLLDWGADYDEWRHVDQIKDEMQRAPILTVPPHLAYLYGLPLTYGAHANDHELSHAGMHRPVVAAYP